jgi:two-component sensor histidine kinase
MYSRLKPFFIEGCLDTLDSIHDRSRVTLLFNLSLAATLMGGLSAIISTALGTYSVYVPAFGNITFGLITLFSIKFTNRYVGISKVYFTLLFLLVFGNLIFNHGTMHIGAPFWIMLLNILVLYVIGLYWGIVFMFFSLLGFWYYLYYIFPASFSIFSNLSREVYYSVYYEAFFALYLLGYIIYTILSAGKQSDLLLKKQNKELLVQNHEISLREEEKTILLKEIHHRVKNNLQVITSLLRLQMHELKNDNEIDKFKDSINRVMTMALIHDKMYQSKEFSRINLEDYFKGLSRDLMDSYRINFEVDLKFELFIDKIGLKSIVPLALIYNELFSNSLKHAFTTTKSPKIMVCIEKYDEDFFLFTYQDNGNWKTVNDKRTSFGKELIEALTDQLYGEMTLKTNPKTEYVFKFKHLDL